jgi:pyruvate/2-oxoglutarate/acetoin dehydrogenase E1 component
MSYFDELTLSMTMLAEHPKTLFVGQSVAYDGQRAHKSFAGVPMERRIEMPICEDFTIGFCTGLALEGYIPVCFIPRWDFLVIAANQLINHLDKIPLMSSFRAKVIIRTAVGAMKPLNPGHQHTQDHTRAFKLMLKTITILELGAAYQVVPAYHHALNYKGSFIVVEKMELYNT